MIGPYWPLGGASRESKERTKILSFDVEEGESTTRKAREGTDAVINVLV